jgi:spore coat protein U-like protein
VVFGSYDPVGTHRTADLNSVGAVVVACVKGTNPTIALGTGMHASGTQRRMRDTANSDYLAYELYHPSSNAAGAPCSFPGTTPWRAAGANLFSATAAPSRTARTYNVCGTVAAGQNPLIGTYSDTVVATVSF